MQRLEEETDHLTKEWNRLIDKHNEKIRAEVFNKMKNTCKHSHFTYDKDSHCSGYNYCMLNGFDCVCNFENCEQLKEQNK